MTNFHNAKRRKLQVQKPQWPPIPTHPYRKLTVGGSGLGETNALLNLIHHQPLVTDNIYLHVKDLCEPKYQHLINKRENVSVNQHDDPNIFIKHSSFMNDAYKNINENNQVKKKRKVLIAFDDMIAGMISNKKKSNRQ